jgi:hypothetical protein
MMLRLRRPGLAGESRISSGLPAPGRTGRRLPAAILLATALLQAAPVDAAPFESSDLPQSVLVEERDGKVVVGPVEPIIVGALPGEGDGQFDGVPIGPSPVETDGGAIVGGSPSQTPPNVVPGTAPHEDGAATVSEGFTLPSLPTMPSLASVGLSEFGSGSSATPCRDGSCGTCRSCCPTVVRDCDPPGLLQKLACLHHKDDGCWAVRTDALILWRNAPPGRAIVETGATPGLPFLNANQLDSTAAAGPRFSLFRGNPCTGDAWEATYLRAANFRSQRYFYASEGPFALANPGIYGNGQAQNFDQGYANLGSSLQSFEFNRHVCHGKHLKWLAGFRWVQWNEQFTLADQAPGDIVDFYQNTCVNDLYGGQIGLDAYLLSLPWLRVDSVLKAGAYYNTAVQNSLYASNAGGALESQGVSVAGTPASCAFVGELGFTGIVPITDCLDFRFGYFGLWLSGIAQPTQQLSGQTLNLVDSPIGSLNMRGGTIVQGVSLGLEGRW